MIRQTFFRLGSGVSVFENIRREIPLRDDVIDDCAFVSGFARHFSESRVVFELVIGGVVNFFITVVRDSVRIVAVLINRILERVFKKYRVRGNVTFHADCTRCGRIVFDLRNFFVRGSIAVISGVIRTRATVDRFKDIVILSLDSVKRVFKVFVHFGVIVFIRLHVGNDRRTQTRERELRRRVCLCDNLGRGGRAFAFVGIFRYRLHSDFGNVILSVCVNLNDEIEKIDGFGHHRREAPGKIGHKVCVRFAHGIVTSGVLIFAVVSEHFVCVSFVEFDRFELVYIKLGNMVPEMLIFPHCGNTFVILYDFDVRHVVFVDELFQNLMSAFVCVFPEVVRADAISIADDVDDFIFVFSLFIPGAVPCAVLHFYKEVVRRFCGFCHHAVFNVLKNVGDNALCGDTFVADNVHHFAVEFERLTDYFTGGCGGRDPERTHCVAFGTAAYVSRNGDYRDFCDVAGNRHRVSVKLDKFGLIAFEQNVAVVGHVRREFDFVAFCDFRVGRLIRNKRNRGQHFFGHYRVFFACGNRGVFIEFRRNGNDGFFLDFFCNNKGIAVDFRDVRSVDGKRITAAVGHGNREIDRTAQLQLRSVFEVCRHRKGGCAALIARKQRCRKKRYKHYAQCDSCNFSE